MKYLGFNPNWRSEFSAYRFDPRFKHALSQLVEVYDGQFSERRAAEHPFLLTLIGLPGSGKSDLGQKVAKEKMSVSLESTPILQWLEEQAKNDQWIYPSSYVAYFYQEELVRHYLQQGVSVVVGAIAKRPGYFDQLQEIAEENSVQTMVVVLESQDLNKLMNQAVNELTRLRKLRDWPNFAENAKRPGSDESVFMANNANWQDKLYGDFMKGRWERWQADFVANPVADSDADKVVRMALDNLPTEQVLKQVLAAL